MFAKKDSISGLFWDCKGVGLRPGDRCWIFPVLVLFTPPNHIQLSLSINALLSSPSTITYWISDSREL
jgi:hypothetical protein